METISFWSLRDNSERAKSLVRTARELLNKDNKVFVLDTNVFSPELHLDLLKEASKSQEYQKKTLLDYMAVFQRTGEAPDSLSKYTIKERNQYFMGANYSSIENTVRNLYNINWEYFFPHEENEEPRGLNLFLNLRNRIKDEFEVDYLLINTPPGITDIGRDLNWFVADKCMCFQSKDKDEQEYLSFVYNTFNSLSERKFKVSKLIFDLNDLIREIN